MWNGQQNVMVTIPVAYWNRTCGLCGTFDGDKHNDFALQDGSLVRQLYNSNNNYKTKFL